MDFFVAKGVVETILTRLGAEARFESARDESLLAGRAANIVIGDNTLGVVGELHPKVAKSFEISSTACIIELDLDKLLTLATDIKTFKAIPRYPSTSRDVALVVDEKVTFQQICLIIQSFDLVSSVALFDFYLGEQVPPGKKSLAFRIVYQSSMHTLTDREVDEVQQQIINRLHREVGAVLRS
jgi:phenylalanyl-tRNA synthetase beta chain